MIYIFLFTIIVFFFMTLILFKFDMSSPSFMLCASYVMCSMMTALNYKAWGIVLSYNTIFIVLFGILLFVLANLAGYYIYDKLPKKSVKRSIVKEIYVPNRVYILSIILLCLSLIVYIVKISKIASLYGNYGSIISMMENARKILTSENIGVGFLAQQLFNVSHVLTYIYLYLYIYNYFVLRKKYKKYLIPILLYCILSLMTTGRIYLLYFVTAFYTLFFIYNNNFNLNNFKKKFQIIVKAIFLVLSFLVLFGLLANVVGRNTTHSVWEQISIYLGGPLVALEKFLQNSIESRNKVWGSETFLGIYRILNQFGLSDITLTRHLEYVRFGNNWGNVYTAFRRYIHDFGIVGTFIIQIILGFSYGLFYRVIRNKFIFDKKVLIYIMFVYPIILHPIDDLFLSNVLTPITVEYVLIICLFFKFIKKI